MLPVMTFRWLPYQSSSGRCLMGTFTTDMPALHVLDRMERSAMAIWGLCTAALPFCS